MEYFLQIEYWHWLVFGLVLLILEIFAPGAILLWFGVGALVVGVLQLLMPGVMPPEVQWLVFSLISVASLVLWKRYAKKHKLDQDDDSGSLNQRSKSLIGREFNLSNAIVNGVGKVRVGDSYWRVEGPDLPEGNKVKVVGFEGATLKVEAVNPEA
ncbi:MAG TPA: NfeD family protein [Kangiella sp.]|uniref:NfeD family protein n=1 Tax=Kangiella sp. TaxID=1920245 RepID=UPI002F9205B4